MRVANRMYGMRDSGNGTCKADDEACLRDQEDWNDANGCLADHETHELEEDEDHPPRDRKGPRDHDDEDEDRPPKRLEEEHPPRGDGKGPRDHDEEGDEDRPPKR